jgi:hypothetical protein
MGANDNISNVDEETDGRTTCSRKYPSDRVCPKMAKVKEETLESFE